MISLASGFSPWPSRKFLSLKSESSSRYSLKNGVLPFTCTGISRISIMRFSKRFEFKRSGLSSARLRGISEPGIPSMLSMSLKHTAHCTRTLRIFPSRAGSRISFMYSCRGAISELTCSLGGGTSGFTPLNHSVAMVSSLCRVQIFPPLHSTISMPYSRWYKMQSTSLFMSPLARLLKTRWRFIHTSHAGPSVSAIR